MNRPHCPFRRPVAARGSVACALLLAAFAPPAAVAEPAAAHPAHAARPAAAAPLAADEVRALMQRVEHAARLRDVDRLAAALADDCRIELRARIAGQEHVTRFTKGEYVEMLHGGYAAMRDLQQYDYEMRDLQVVLEPGGTAATVRADVFERSVFQGVQTQTRSVEESRVERRGDALVLVAVTATTEAAAPPAPR